MWVLDVQPLAAGIGAMLEMQVFGSLGVILDCMADVWDEADGHGVLGLSHLHVFAGRRRGVAGADWQTEIMAICGARLGAIARRRGWTQQPNVIDLDLRDPR